MVTFFWKKLCCPGAMTRRWAPQTCYALPRITYECIEKFLFVLMFSTICFCLMLSSYKYHQKKSNFSRNKSRIKACQMYFILHKVFKYKPSLSSKKSEQRRNEEFISSNKSSCGHNFEDIRVWLFVVEANRSKSQMDQTEDFFSVFNYGLAIRSTVPNNLEKNIVSIYFLSKGRSQDFWVG